MKKENKQSNKIDPKHLTDFLVKVVEEQKKLIYDRTSSRKNKEMLDHIEKTLDGYLK